MEELYDRTGMILAGRYRITELLGAGSMGSVWVAEQLALRTQVVVKFREELLIGADGEESAARFLREARTLASVRHRNVVELFEVGTADTGEPYLIMEKLKGQTLGALLAARRTLPLAEAFALFSGIARGLEAVHAAGIVHRDVKPDNIFLVAQEDDGPPIPKLLDFGLARGTELGGGGLSSKITRAGRAVGTPGYMPSEQVRGLADLDERVDVYALAATFYEMLAAACPVEGESLTDVLIATATDGPTPLDAHRPDYAGPLTMALMRGLAVDRDSRYPTVRAMRERLAKVIGEWETQGVTLPPAAHAATPPAVRSGPPPIPPAARIPARTTERPVINPPDGPRLRVPRPRRASGGG